MKKKLLLLALLITGAFSVKAQYDSKTITYEDLYDDPYDIQKLFVSFNPIYTELFVANVSVGFGFDAAYYLTNKANFHASFRRSYAQQLDQARDVAIKNVPIRNEGFSNWWDPYAYYELGGTYHIVDKEIDTETKMVLFSKRYRASQMASKMPETFKVPSKKRVIYGGRGGGVLMNTTTDIGRALEAQGISREEIVDVEGSVVPENALLMANLSSRGFFIGGSMILIKNVAVKPDRFSALANDLIFTVYCDILVAPNIMVSDIIYGNSFYSSSPLKTNMIGGRVGMDGKFNREFGWGYGAELGYRPGISGRGFYALVKISFPVFGTSLDNTREAFGK